MKKLTANGHKTLDALKAKANETWINPKRMPSIKRIYALLVELGISCELQEWSERKHRSAEGLRFSTSGGSKEYNGYRLKILEINLHMNTTETYYSANTYHYAQKIVALIDSKNNNN